jgi:uracil-DNA glycosylase
MCPFLQIHSDLEVPPCGDLDAKIAIIGEAPGRDEVRARKPFVGQAGRVLEEVCHNAGIIKSQLYLTNVIKVKPPDTSRKRNDISPYFNERTGRFTDKGQPWINSLMQELSEVKANILIPMGKTAAAAIIGPPAHKITKYRGYVYKAEGPALDEPRKALPTLHTAETLYAPANYFHRHYIAHDLMKAKLNSASPDIQWDSVEAIVPKDANEAQACLEYFLNVPLVSMDTESMNYEVTCISFADSRRKAVAIDFLHNKWTEEEERMLWEAITRIVESEEVTLIGQNLIHDLELLALRMGIVYKGYIRDTMIMHSLMYPDFSKGLGFLGSVYTNLPYWKDMVRFNDSKEDS